jgi:hypothetical protein
VTVVGPLRVTVGAVPPLWHEVHVDPFFPEKPEMPPLLAAAGSGNKSAIIVTSAIQDSPMARDCSRRRRIVFGMDAAGTGFTAAKAGRKFLSSTVASFLRLRLGA